VHRSTSRAARKARSSRSFFLASKVPGTDTGGDPDS
jgi:hypothetical protein